MADKRRAPYVSNDRSVVDLTKLNATLGSQAGSSSLNGYLGSPVTSGAVDSSTWVESPVDASKPNGYLPHGDVTYTSSIYNGEGTKRPSVVYPQPLPFDPRSNPYALPGGQHRRQGGSMSSSSSPPFQSTLARLLSSPLPSPSTLKFIFLCTLWYGTSAVSSNSGKVILNNFKFPVTLTIVQFFFVAAYCWILTEGRSWLGLNVLKRAILRRFSGSRSLTQVQAGGSRLRSPSKAILRNTWPMAVFQVGGHIFSSMAISRVPVSTVHTIKVSRRDHVTCPRKLLTKARLYSTSTSR